MATPEASTRPSYGRPPVVEVAISARFSTGSTINPGHLGAFWSTVKDRFPSVVSTQPIASPKDDAAARWTPPLIQFALTSRPDCRLQMTQIKDDAWMWQVQSDRLVVNWRRRPGSEYPRYSRTLEEFRQAWNQWTGFLNEIAIESLAPLSWEITYVNEIRSGPDELWTSPSEWPMILPGLFGGRFQSEAGLDLKGLHGEWVWDHAEPQARLVVSPAPATRSNQHLLMLTLTARGPVDQADPAADSITSSSDSLSAYETGLNLGHRLIVNTFDTLGSENAKKHWERHDHA